MRLGKRLAAMQQPDRLVVFLILCVDYLCFAHIGEPGRRIVPARRIEAGEVWRVFTRPGCPSVAGPGKSGSLAYQHGIRFTQGICRESKQGVEP